MFAPGIIDALVWASARVPLPSALQIVNSSLRLSGVNGYNKRGSCVYDGPPSVGTLFPPPPTTRTKSVCLNVFTNSVNCNPKMPSIYNPVIFSKMRLSKLAFLRKIPFSLKTIKMSPQLPCCLNYAEGERGK